MRKLIDVNEAELLTQGLFPDLPANQLGLWRFGKNVDFIGSGPIKTQGRTAEASPGGTIYAITQGYAEGVRRAYLATQDKLWRWEYGALHQIGGGFNGLGYWQLEPFGNWLLATNDYDAPRVWKQGSGDSVPLAGVRRPRFRLIKKHQNHVLGYFGQSVDWSHKGNPELWEPQEDNSAGGQFIRDLDSDIIAVQRLGRNMGIYSLDKLVIQQYLGDPLYFGFNTGVENIGALSDSGIIPVSNRNFGVDPKGFFVTDGISAERIDTPRVRRWFKDNINMDEARRTVGLHDEANEVVKWWFPCKDGTIKGLSFNYKRGAWGILEMPVTAAAEHEVYDAPLVASGVTWGFAKGINEGVTPLPVELRSFPFDSQQRENYKTWDLLRAEFKGDIQVRFGFSDDAEAEPEWTPWTPLLRENWIHRESVFLTVHLRALGFNHNFEISGFSIHGEPGGYV
jgi:hypothetical protein